MQDVVLIKFKDAGKVYYFDPNGFDITPNMGVIVETSRGMEFGISTAGITEVKEESIKNPLKKVIRIANQEDFQIHEENERKKDKAIKLCQEKIELHNLDMKLIDVEYTFDNNKIIFYFTSEGRVDFRELVKDLASVFKMRIELRQIGVRDEAKMLGGVGACGKGLCCATWIREFQPVSIKMAKVQNLSLNPTKISGVCGRLMCCLKYENDMYMDLQKGMPSVNERVETPQGQGKVIESSILAGKVKVRLFSGEVDENGVDKMETDVLTFSKEDIKRVSNRKGCCKGKCMNMEDVDLKDLRESDETSMPIEMEELNPKEDIKGISDNEPTETVKKKKHSVLKKDHGKRRFSGRKHRKKSMKEHE